MVGCVVDLMVFGELSSKSLQEGWDFVRSSMKIDGAWECEPEAPGSALTRLKKASWL